jgi:hypothetical protein
MARVATAQQIGAFDDHPKFEVEQGETLITLENATLHSFKLMPTGEGFDIHITVALTEAAKLPALTDALQKAVDVHFVRYNRRARRSLRGKK